MNKENIAEVVKNFGLFLEENFDEFNSIIIKIDDILDDIRDNDGFGTEGQLDPRGDNRDE